MGSRVRIIVQHRLDWKSGTSPKALTATPIPIPLYKQSETKEKRLSFCQPGKTRKEVPGKR